MATPVKTFADVLAALSRQPDLPARTRADLASAVRCFCRVMELDPTVADAGDLSALQKQLAKSPPERAGLSPARWSVIRSQLLRALEVTGAAKPLRTASVELTPAWAILMDALPGKRQQLALSRFARFCCSAGVAPEDVNQDTFGRYAKALTSSSLVRNAEDVCRVAAAVWTDMPENLRGQGPAHVPQAVVRRTRKRGRYPLSAFPAAFQRDLDAFRQWCMTADPLDDAARPKALRAQTVMSYSSNLHTAADAAVRSGMPIGEIVSLSVLADAAVYLRILRRLLADTEPGVSSTVHNVATMIPIIARDWLRQTPEQIAELKRLKAKLPRRRPGLTRKNRDLLAAFEDKALLDRFLRLEDELWREAQSPRMPSNQRLVRAQMALLIGILQIAPLRRRNVCALAFNTHITWPNGPAAHALIQVKSAEMKTDIEYLGELPLGLSRRLHQYRTRLAQEITGHVPSRLFIRSDGIPKTQEAVVNRLVVTLRKRLGIHMTAHQFRHLGGKLMLDANPGAYEAVSQLLGHTGTKNVMRFYGGADTRRATRHHAALIGRLREEAQARTGRRRKT